MSEVKEGFQEKESEGFNVDDKLPPSSEKVKPKSGKGQRSAKTKRAKKVIVNMPVLTRRIDDDHKLFPKGIDAVKCTLEQITEETKDKQTNEVVLNMKGDLANKENIQDALNEDKSQVNEHDQPNGNTENSDTSNGNVTTHTQVYGMFSRTNTEISLRNVRSNSVGAIYPSKRKQSCSSIKRPKSTRGWSKKEIDLFLPRKSFFGVHDNTLSSAGFKIRSDEERNIPEWRKILRMRTQEELFPPEEKTEEPVVPTMGILDDDSGDDEPYGMENVETAMSTSNKEHGTTKGKRKSKDKKVTNAEREEYRPLYDYLKYIHDNPDEYIQANKYVAKNNDYKHPNNMVRLARAYRRGHHGANKNSIYIHAITNLKHRVSETVVLRTARAEKGNTSNDTGEQTATQDETEIEKLKSKAEKWAKGLTTQNLLRAIELALKDVGDEDVTMSKWWLVFRSCHYLRIPSHITETSH